jgi:outer membrane protein
VRFIVKRSVIVFLAAALTGFASLASAQIKIGVVNTDMLLQNSPQFAAAQTAINAEFLPRQNEIQALQKYLVAKDETLRKDGATMTELQRTQAERELTEGARTLKSKSEAADEDFNARREEEMAKLQKLLRAEIETFAKANGYDLIMVSGVGYTTAALDVTKPLLESLNKKAGVTAAPAAAAPAAKPPATAPAATKPPAAPSKP